MAMGDIAFNLLVFFVILAALLPVFTLNTLIH